MGISKTTVLIFLFSIAILVLLFTGWLPPQRGVDDELIGVMRPAPRELKAFTLLDQNNQEFNLDRFAGKWSFVFFGYTYCPDICPVTLSTLTSVYKKLDEYGISMQKLNTFFISVDPQRDNTEKLAKYVAYFDKSFLGITGEKQQIDDIARQFGAGYMIEPKRESGDYLISHTSSIFLVDPKKRILANFSPPHEPETIAMQFKTIVASR